MSYLRFVVPERDVRTGQLAGLMSVVYELLRSNDLTPHEEGMLREHASWIEANVKIPTRFSRKRHVSHKHTHGLSWVKAGAAEVVRRLYVLSAIAERHGHAVEVLQSDRPGYVVYEDDFQIVAEPFHGSLR